MSIIETSSKVYEPKTYDEVIADPIHGTRWRQAIEEIHNLRYIVLGGIKNYQKAERPLDANEYLG